MGGLLLGEQHSEGSSAFCSTPSGLGARKGTGLCARRAEEWFTALTACACERVVAWGTGRFRGGWLKQVIYAASRVESFP